MFQVYSQVIQFPLYIHVCVGVCGCVCVSALNHGWLFVIWWTVARQAPLSVGFSRQEYWSSLPFPSPEDLSNPGIKPGSPTLLADYLLSEPQESAWYYLSKGLILFLPIPIVFSLFSLILFLKVHVLSLFSHVRLFVTYGL